MKINMLPYLIVLIISFIVKFTNSDTLKKSIFEFNKEASSLTFVFDVSGSMNDELDYVKQGSSVILDMIARYEEKIIRNYIFIPFNDPVVGPHTVTTNISEFRKIIRNTQVDGGGDCPEKSLTAIKESLEISLPKSFIFVFTDANPKDTYWLQEVIKLIREKSSRIIFFLTGSCNQLNINPKEFEQIASISTGLIFNLEKTKMYNAVKLIEMFLQPQKVNLIAVDSLQTLHPFMRCFPIYLDETITHLQIYISGTDKILFQMTESVMKQKNETSEEQTSLDLNYIKVINLKHPHPGIRNIFVSSSTKYSLRVTATSNVSFIYGFSIIYTTNISNISSQPFRGVPNYVLLMPTNVFLIKNLTTCEMKDLNGVSINFVILRRMKASLNTYYGLFTPNNIDFHLQVTGFSKSKHIFSRITNSAINFDTSALLINLFDGQPPVLHNNYSLTCEVQSGQPFQVEWQKDGYSITNRSRYDSTGQVTINIPKITFADAGNYTCLVFRKNDGKSKSVIIRVNYSPSINQTFSSQIYLKLNEDYAIPCSASGYPESKISWYFNYTTVIRETQYNNSVVLLPDHTLLLLSMSANLSGFYSCIAENEVGKDFRHYEVTVTENTNNTDSNVTLIKCEMGKNAILYCSNKENRTVRWLKNNLPLDMSVNARADESKIILENNGNKLSILEVDQTDEGYYTCIPTTVDDKSENLFFLQVLIPLSFQDDGETVVHRKVQDNENVTLDCTSDGYPISTTTWRKKDLMLPVNKWTLKNTTLGGPHKQILIIYPFRKDLHSGTYECEVRNEISTIQRTFKLI